MHGNHMTDDQRLKVNRLREKIQEIGHLAEHKSVLPETEKISAYLKRTGVTLKELGIRVDLAAILKTGFRSEAVNALQIAQRRSEHGLVNDIIHHMDDWLSKAKLDRRAIGTSDAEIDKLKKKGHISEARNLLKRAEEHCLHTDVEHIVSQIDEILKNAKVGRDHIHLNDRRAANILCKGYLAKAQRLLNCGHSNLGPHTGVCGPIAQKLFAESGYYLTKAQAIALEYDLGEVALKSLKKALPMERGVHP